MADLFSILQSNYVAVGSTGAAVADKTPYVAVDPAMYRGSWSGAYADNTKFNFQISNVEGFRAKVRYQSGAVTKYQDVLIKSGGFRIGDSRFQLTKQGTAQIKSVLTNNSTGAQSLETAYAKQS
jgi:hypothetical protein